MKIRTSLILVTLLALIVAGCSKHSPAVATSPQPIRFDGFTNGYVGPLAPVFASLSTNDAAVIQRWLAAGTNDAVFTITNQQTCDIWLFPLGRISSASTHTASEESPILNSPNFSGIRLRPRQVTSIQVAMLPYQMPWQMQFYYTRTDQHVGFVEGLSAIIFRKPIHMQTYTIESGLISQRP
jgi:hypothetical protein